MLNFRPLLNEKIQFYNSTYKRNYYVTSIRNNYNPHMNAFGNERNLLNSIRSVVGEYIERDVVSSNNINIKLDSFNLVNGNKKSIESKHFLLNTDLPILRDEPDHFTDTCGLATHTSSSKAILNALFEFLERQSLILTWLSKRVTYEISNNVLPQLLDFKLKHIKWFIRDVSLWDFIYVILIIGIDEKNQSFTIGCCADVGFNKAVDGAYSEAIMILESINSKNKSNNIEADLYSERFFNLAYEEFIEQIKFLIEDTKYPDYKCTNSRKFSFDMLNETGLGIYCTILPSKSIPVFKTVKVFSEDAFPHMNTEILEPELYKITKHFGYNNFPNKYKALPFP